MVLRSIVVDAHEIWQKFFFQWRKLKANFELQLVEKKLSQSRRHR